jgi:transcriptional regulator of acetoin/glycerol metabolism
MKDLNFEEMASEALALGLYSHEVMDRMEKALLTIAMMKCRGHVQKAAKELGVHRNTVMLQMRKHQLRKEAFR